MRGAAGMAWNFGKREAKGAPVRCNWCRVPLAVQRPGGLWPTAEELHGRGAVSVKLLGWFCGRPCVGSYEKRFRVILESEMLGSSEPGSA